MNIDQQLEKAQALAQAGDHERSRRVLLDILKSDGHHRAALMMLGGSYFVCEQYNKAQMVFERLVALSPLSGQFSIALFNTLWKMARRQEALAEIRRFTRQASRDEAPEIFTQYEQIRQAVASGEQ